MSRNSNDDRSDSMNPNNDSYWASLDNHRTQTGDFDDDTDVVAKSSFSKPVVKTVTKIDPKPIDILATSSPEYVSFTDGFAGLKLPL